MMCHCVSSLRFYNCAKNGVLCVVDVSIIVAFQFVLETSPVTIVCAKFVFLLTAGIDCASGSSTSLLCGRKLRTYDVHVCVLVDTVMCVLGDLFWELEC